MIPKKLSISCALAHVLISPCVNPKRLPGGQFLLEKLLSSLLHPMVALETLDKTSITQVVLVLRMLLYMAIKNPRSKLGPPAMLKAVSNLESVEAKLLVDIVTKDAGPFLDQLDALFDGPGLVCGSKLHNMLIETHSAQQGNPLYDKCVEFCNLASDTDTLVSPSVVACFRKKVRHALEAINLKRPRPTDANSTQLANSTSDTTSCVATKNHSKTNLSTKTQPITQPNTKSSVYADKTTTKTPTTKTPTTKHLPLKPHALKANTPDPKMKAKKPNKKLVHTLKSDIKSEAKKTKKPDQVHDTKSTKSETKKNDTKQAPKQPKKKLDQVHDTKFDTKSDINLETKKLKRKLGHTQDTNSIDTQLESKRTTHPDFDKSKPALKKRKADIKEAIKHLKRSSSEASATSEKSVIKSSKTETYTPNHDALTKPRKLVKKRLCLLGKQKEACHEFEYNPTSKKLKLSKKLKSLLDKPCSTTSSTTTSDTSSKTSSTTSFTSSTLPSTASSTDIVKNVGCYYPDPPEGGWYGVVSNAAVIFTFTHLPLLVERSNKRENKRKKGDKPVQVVLRVVQHKDSVSLVLVQNLGDCLAHVDLGMADFAGLLGVPLAVDRQALRNIPILTCAEGLCMAFDPATMLLTCSVN